MLSWLDGFAGDIQLVADGLPEGFQFSATTLTGGQTTSIVTLAAPEGAAVGTVISIQIKGRATIDGQERTRSASATESHSYITDTRQVVTVRDAAISVSPLSSFRLRRTRRRRQ